ncbi:hypothetical protein DRQ26_05605 [bacterium]|nr:MAG: hypothetical protein DRQ26_05605 [bacterium]
MKSKFCPLCGKKTDTLFDGLCESCFSKEKLAKIPKKIKVFVCKNCGKINGNIKLDENGLKKIIRDNLEVNGELKKIEILKVVDKRKNFKKIEMEVSGLLKGKLEKKEIVETTIEIKKRLCETCGKVKGGYYEAIIQIRSDKKVKEREALKVIVKRIEKEGGLITKIEEKNGIDIYFTPKKILNRVVKKIPKIKEIKKSYTLVTKKDGRDLYRNTVLVRL